jgi:ethanolamine ammonia-lyase small subunit
VSTDPTRRPGAGSRPAPPMAGLTGAMPPAALAVPADPWHDLRRFTPARLALGRTGGSAPTAALLAFNLDHALARDAVHAPFDAASLAAALSALPAAPEVLPLATVAPDRATFLRRPDQGGQLDPSSAARLEAQAALAGPAPDLVIVISDGLSALAAHRQGPPLLAALLPLLRTAGLTLAPLCVVRHARVALLAEVGSRLRASLALILLGERPGLGTPDSLGAYFEFAPQPGHTNADRNCVSNIRPAGLPPPAAAEKIVALLLAARAQRQSGVTLKDDTPGPLAAGATPARIP